MRKRKTAFAALLSVTALVVAACGLRDDGGGGDGDVALGTGVSEDPCPDTPNEDNGCITLGLITDETGQFQALGETITEAQKAFWQRVNEEGGIQAGDQAFDVDVTSHVENNDYNPQTHREVFNKISGDVLALGQSLGSPMTNTILEDLESEDIIAAPATWSSEWAFTDVVLQAGTNYCVESMNAVDYAIEEFDVESVMAVHYPGDYGGDAAGGAEHAAEANDLEFDDVETAPGEDQQAGAIRAITSNDPDLVIVTTGPTEAATIIGRAVSNGYDGQFIGTSPTWNPGLLDTGAAGALEEHYLQSAPWGTYTSESDGHSAMREAVGAEDADDGYTAGWVWSYAIKAALEQAAEDGDLTREGVRNAAGSLTEIDYEGMLPNEAGNYADEPNEALFRQTIINQVDPDSGSGVSELEGFFTGPTAEEFEFTEQCF